MDVTDITPIGSATGIPLPVVLVIEESPQDATVLLDAFREQKVGVRVITTSTAIEALGMLRLLPTQSQPRLIVVDVLSPGMKGHEILSALNENPQWRSIPKVMLTTQRSDTDRIRSLGRGAIAHVVKPSTFPGYLDLVEGLMSAMTMPLTAEPTLVDLRSTSLPKNWYHLR